MKFNHYPGTFLSGVCVVLQAQKWAIQRWATWIFWSSCNQDFRGCGQAGILSLENQDLSWGCCNEVCGVLMLRLHLLPVYLPCLLVGKERNSWSWWEQCGSFPPTFLFFYFRVRRPSSLQEMVRGLCCQIAYQSEFKASHHQPCDTWGVARMHGSYFLLNLPSLNRKILPLNNEKKQENRTWGWCECSCCKGTLTFCIL